MLNQIEKDMVSFEGRGIVVQNGQKFLIKSGIGFFNEDILQGAKEVILQKGSKLDKVLTAVKIVLNGGEHVGINGERVYAIGEQNSGKITAKFLNGINAVFNCAVDATNACLKRSSNKNKFEVSEWLHAESSTLNNVVSKGDSDFHGTTVIQGGTYNRIKAYDSTQINDANVREADIMDSAEINGGECLKIFATNSSKIKKVKGENLCCYHDVIVDGLEYENIMTDYGPTLRNITVTDTLYLGGYPRLGGAINAEGIMYCGDYSRVKLEKDVKFSRAKLIPKNGGYRPLVYNIPPKMAV